MEHEFLLPCSYISSYIICSVESTHQNRENLSLLHLQIVVKTVPVCGFKLEPLTWAEIPGRTGGHVPHEFGMGGHNVECLPYGLIRTSIPHSPKMLQSDFA